MYPKNAASPPRIAVGAVVQISDGAVQSSGVSIAVVPEGGASGAGGGTTAYDNGIVLYTPTQAETNYTAFIVTAYKTGCIPASVTVVTTVSDTSGYAGLDWANVLNKTSTVALTGTTIATTQKVDVETIKTQTVTCAAGVTVGAYVGGTGAAALEATSQTILADTNELQTDWTNGGRLDLILDATLAAASSAGDPWNTSLPGAYASGKAGYIVGTFIDATLSNIETDTQDIQSRIPAALSSGNIKADVLAINNSTSAAARLALSAAQIIPGTVDTATNSHTPTTTQFQADDITEATTDHYVDRLVIFTSGTLLGQATTITGYVATGGIGQFTVTAMTEAPANNDTFIII